MLAAQRPCFLEYNSTCNAESGKGKGKKLLEKKGFLIIAKYMHVKR